MNFKDTCDGYGFEEVQVRPDGTYCEGCLQVLKRPYKMYSDGHWTLCKHCVEHFYGDFIKPNCVLWFEYHCWESPQSGDAEAWYHSHQQVTVLGLSTCEKPLPTFAERAAAGMQLVYRVRFQDGLEWDVFEDELLRSPSDFQRPDPPKRTPA